MDHPDKEALRGEVVPVVIIGKSLTHTRPQTPTTHPHAPSEIEASTEATSEDPFLLIVTKHFGLYDGDLC